MVLASTLRRRFARGEVVFHESDLADTVHFVAEGRLAARRTTRAGDTVTFAGEITGKRVENGKKIVECRIRGTNQNDELVALCDATMVLPE